MPTDAPHPPVLAENLTRRFRAPHGSILALAGVSCSIPPARFVALLGPNGSGKSTLMRILAGLDRPSEGTARVFGLPPASAHAAARRGVVFQNPALDPLLSVRENLALQAALASIPAAQARPRIDTLARDFDIADRLHHRVGTLSGGLKRRADLARALLPEPDLLLLDEPTVGLDPGARAAFLDAILRIRARRPLTILMSTHLLDEAEHADRVLLIHQGRLVRDGSPDHLRAECGRRILRTRDSHAARDLLRRAGLDPAPQPDGSLVAPQPDGHADAIALAARLLTEHDIPFRVGPPTLADVYAHATGHQLTPDPA